ncbi:MAG: hypothetical protein PHH24_03775 [Candidatus Moranbacteria bacterium]|jgi:hypothetical protein|nr:hypothetical protein [Candidatus Moranbacteria bacterium]MDD5652358.1 hypothetical protein [Candidatus Moranbacteria bacterium]MDX9855365.1 hypothetical protein [Candidatus Moranbacteria bacterium]
MDISLKSIKFNKNNFDLKKIKDHFWNFLLKRFGTIFVSFFLIASLIGGFIIYKYIYNSDWSEYQKKEYRSQVEKNESPFDMDKFDKVMDNISRKKESSGGETIIPKDIFGTTD